MTDFLQYAYVFVWGILAVLMFFTGKKQGAFAYVLSLFFLYMCIWYGLETFLGLPMFDGVFSIIFRCVLAVFLILLIGVCIIARRKNAQNNENSADK